MQHWCPWNVTHDKSQGVARFVWKAIIQAANACFSIPRFQIYNGFNIHIYYIEVFKKKCSWGCPQNASEKKKFISRCKGSSADPRIKYFFYNDFFFKKCLGCGRSLRCTPLPCSCISLSTTVVTLPNVEMLCSPLKRDSRQWLHIVGLISD